MTWLARSLVLVLLVAIGGCGGAADDDYMGPDRKAKGLVIILPGIEGESSFNHQIRYGLMAGGIDWALPIYRWGRPVPVAGMLLNQMDFIGNRIEAAKIAGMIVQYQDSYPNRPVYLVGHSGGGGMAVFAVEALPEGRQVDGVVLLSASISSVYDLTRALRHCRKGIANYYNTADVGLLGIGTIIAGNVDGIHGPSAGLIGFNMPGPGSSKERLSAYERLRQHRLDEAYFYGEDAHAAATSASFISSQVAPWISSDVSAVRGSLLVARRPD
ncbi:MAG: hypothetical protein ACE15C_05630 [Phycisphaerae bacterium]